MATQTAPRSVNGGLKRRIHVIRDGRAVLNSILYLIRHSEKLQAQKFHDDRRLFGPQPAELVGPMSQPQAKRHVQQWCLMVGRDGKTTTCSASAMQRSRTKGWLPTHTAG